LKMIRILTAVKICARLRRCPHPVLLAEYLL